MRVEAGWLYEGPSYYEQSQGFFVPVMDDDGNMHLVDTYMIGTGFGDGTRGVENATKKIVKLGTERNGWTLSKARSDYYHGRDRIFACLDGEVPDGFDPVCYLPDWEWVSDRDAEDYDKDDVRGRVQLFFEHGYRMYGCRHGVMLRRKGAEKSGVRQLEAAIDDTFGSFRMPYAATYHVECAVRLRELVGDLPDDVQRRYDDMLERYNVLANMEREYAKFVDRQTDADAT